MINAVSSCSCNPVLEVQKAESFLRSCNPQFLERGAIYTFETIDSMEGIWHPVLIDKVTNAALVVFGGLNAAKKAEVVRKTAEALEKTYIDPTLGMLMARKLGLGNYDACTNPVEFKNALLRDMRQVFAEKGVPFDPHLNISWHFRPLASESPYRSLKQPTAEEELKLERAAQFESDRNMGFGIPKVDVLEGNIGYVKIDAFAPLYPETKARIEQAMEAVSGTDALIIDLRDNGGGSPEGVAFLASALFDQKTHFSTIRARFGDGYTSREFFADPASISPKARFGRAKKVYLLTSGQTFSAGEALAYGLQAQGRAIVIGEKTKGGANPRRQYYLDDHFLLHIPIETTIDPKTGGNWEGTGVQPDIETKEDALAFALSVVFQAS